MQKKIKKLDELSRIIQRLKEKGDAIVLCHGVFDLLHPGHIRHFEAAKKQGDILVVTVTRDEYVGKGPGKPVFNQRLRVESVAALQCVDYAAINDWPTAVNTIKKLKPDIYAKGSDYADCRKDLTGKIYHEMAAVKSVGGKVHFTDELSFSSTRLANAYFSVYPEETETFLSDFRKRFDVEIVIKRLKELEKLRVMVVGDTIIDEYCYCQPMGKSWKESVISTKYLSQENFAGGVLACANHIAGFCKEVNLVTCLGKKESQEDFIRKKLKPNVKPTFFYRADGPTVIKRRFVEPPFLSKMFEICFLNDVNLSEPINRELCDHLEKNAPDSDLVIVADFGHGFIGKKAVEILCRKAKFLAVNTQTNSANTGFNLITKYPRANYICLDEPEIRLAKQDKFGGLEELMVQVGRDLKCGRVVVTRGHRGSLSYEGGDRFCAVPVFSKEVVDRIGAGDAYFAITSPCVAAGYPMDMVGFIGNAVGALAVRIVGNRTPVEPVPLFKFITALLK